jgi:hypothetical protein
MSTPESRHAERLVQIFAEAPAGPPSSPPPLVLRVPPAAPAAQTPPPRAEAADRCLKCRKPGPSAHYGFSVVRTQGLSRRLLHEEQAFICDRCARAETRFAPLVVLLLWVPLVALAVLCTWRTLWLSLPLLFIAVALVRVAWKQLRAVGHQMYHHPPYSATVAHLAIRLRKKDLLRSLRVVEGEVRFCADADPKGLVNGMFSAQRR